MHVGVLAAVGRNAPVGRGFVGIEMVPRLPEVPLHQAPGVLQPFARVAHAGHQRMRVRQQHKGQAIAVLGAVLHGGVARVPVDLPRVAAPGLRMRTLQESQAMPHRIEVCRMAESAVCVRVVEHEARAAYQVARAAVVDRAVVLEEMKEAA